jgi:hypothetical protein
MMSIMITMMMIMNSNMEEYCASYVDLMGKDVEGPFVQLGVLLKSLDCWGVTVFLHRDENVVMSVYETPIVERDGIKITPLGAIHL